MNRRIERSDAPLNATLGESISFDHVGDSASNLECSHQFYSGVLGFRTLEESFTLPAHEIRGRILLSGHGVLPNPSCSVSRKSALADCH
jgi:hypothetical protein